MMHKRSYAELRKLRKKNKAFEQTLKEIHEATVLKQHDRVAKAIEDCDMRIAEIDEKEYFLRELETPGSDPDTDAILEKVRQRSAELAAKEIELEVLKRFYDGQD